MQEFKGMVVLGEREVAEVSGVQASKLDDDMEFVLIPRGSRKCREGAVCGTRRAVPGLEPLLDMWMWTPPVYAYDSREALRASDEDKSIVPIIGLSEHVVEFVMAFIETCRKGCLLSRVDEFRT